MKQLVFIFVMSFVLVSCTKTYQCSHIGLNLVFNSYDSSNIDTIILRRFTIGKKFMEQLDSVLLSPQNTRYVTNTDSSISLYATNNSWQINDQYDWQIVNPFDYKKVSISEMKFQNLEQKYGGLFSGTPPICYSFFISYKRDNYIVSNFDSISNNLIISK
ncbi:hypothetical protein [Parasediminibacterium sp. JCM 36343]|uniref:hypothetical protein n=1 Tax=Parasediminibacterium sp. JCM 36343 TaxID=3374279 RepID=UPI003977E9EF